MLQHYWSVTIRLFSVISRTRVGGVLPLCRDPVGVFCSPSRLGNELFEAATIYIYIVIHRQICFVQSELISVARQPKFPKLGSKLGWLKRQSKILPLSHEETSASGGNLNGYESQLLLFTYIRLTATESSIHRKSLAYTLMATHLLHSLESSTQQG